MLSEIADLQQQHHSTSQAMESEKEDQTTSAIDKGKEKIVSQQPDHQHEYDQMESEKEKKTEAEMEKPNNSGTEDEENERRLITSEREKGRKRGQDYLAEVSRELIGAMQDVENEELKKGSEADRVEENFELDRSVNRARGGDASNEDIRMSEASRPRKAEGRKKNIRLKQIGSSKRGIESSTGLLKESGRDRRWRKVNKENQQNEKKDGKEKLKRDFSDVMTALHDFYSGEKEHFKEKKKNLEEAILGT